MLPNPPNGPPPLGGPPPPGPHAPPASSPDEFAEEARRWNRANTKEADSIHLQALPDGSHWRAWRANTINAVVAAAGRQDDLAQDWIMRVETDENWALADPGEGWISLDRKLAAALSKIAKGEIGRETLQFADACSSQ